MNDSSIVQYPKIFTATINGTNLDAIAQNFQVFWQTGIDDNRLELRQTFHGFRLIEKHGPQNTEHPRAEIIFTLPPSGEPHIVCQFRLWSIPPEMILFVKYPPKHPPIPESELLAIWNGFIDAPPKPRRRKRTISITKMQNGYEAMKKWLDEGIEKTTACDLAGIDRKEFSKLIPDILGFIDDEAEREKFKRKLKAINYSLTPP